MHLSIEQEELFFETMDALLAFVNDKFDVVEDYALDFDDPLLEAKTELVAAELWGNTAVIDDFVRENPYRLSDRCLDVARAWKSAVRDEFTLVRFQGGNALLMNEDAVFSVCGITAGLDDVVGAAPALLRVVLIPFQGMVLYDGFLHIGNLSALREREMADRFESLLGAGVIATAEQLERYSIEHAVASFGDDIDRLFADIERAQGSDGAGDEPPAGFHRSEIAGLAGDKRRQAVERHLATAFSASRGQSAWQKPLTPAEQEDERALLCAMACVTYCGVVALQDCHEQYVRVYNGRLPIEEFAELVASEAAYGDMNYGLWEDQGTPYLVHFTLTREYVMSQASRWKREGSLRGSVGDELDALESLRAYLLEEHGRFAMRPVPFCTYDNDELEQLYAGPSAQALRAFLDERVPDGQDDYLFVDQMVQEVVLSSIEVGDVRSILEFANENGLEGCCEDPERLRTLISNVFDNVPCWENNGWSSREMREQLTGRKVFYDERGAEMRIGRNDPCPCGSGRLYRDCCGR